MRGEVLHLLEVAGDARRAHHLGHDERALMYRGALLVRRKVGWPLMSTHAQEAVGADDQAFETS